MSTVELLTWARGPGLALSLFVLVAGLVVRLGGIFLLGRRPDLSPPRVRHSGWWGLRTVFTRSLPPGECVPAKIAPFVAGYVFHIGLFLIVFFYVPHILLIEGVTGIGWPGLPPWFIDGVTLVTLAAMLLVFFHRVRDPVRRYLATFDDHYSLAVTFLPVFTGYLAYHRLGGDYDTLLLLHILSVELLLVSLPFTKLTHSVTLWAARWYNGQMAGRRGVKA